MTYLTVAVYYNNYPKLGKFFVRQDLNTALNTAVNLAMRYSGKNETDVRNELEVYREFVDPSGKWAVFIKEEYEEQSEEDAYFEDLLKYQDSLEYEEHLKVNPPKSSEDDEDYFEDLYTYWESRYNGPDYDD